MRETEKTRWDKITKLVYDKFGISDELSTILLFIGIQELGKGFKKYSKQEKTDLMHMATCKALSYKGYYRYNGLDHDKWPIWQRNKPLPKLNVKEQESLLKEGIITYFEENKYL